jgi:hypothetical protein
LCRGFARGVGMGPTLDQLNEGQGHQDNGGGRGGVFSYIAGLRSAKLREQGGDGMPPVAVPTPKWGPRLVLLLSAGLTWTSLLLMLFPSVLWPAHVGRERHQEIDAHFGVAVALACALPPVLAWLSHSLINKRALWDHVRPCFPAVDAALENARGVAEASWTYELERAHSNLARAEVFAGLWGVIASMAMAGAVIFLIPPFHVVATPFAGAANVLAFGLLGTTVTSFLLELARLSLRTSDDDATKRMFADALRTLILSIITTLLVMLMAPVIGPDSLKELAAGAAGAGLAALGVGASIAILGPPAFEWGRSRLASAFGIEQKEREVGTPLDKLDDIGPSELARLAEEGIETVEALVNTPVARLFLSTRFSLQRIVSWHDVGLLITRVGAASAGDLRSRWGVRGCAEVRRTMCDAGEEKYQAALRAIFQKAMRVDGPDEAELVLRQLARDERVSLVEVLRNTRIERGGRAKPHAAE